MADDEKDSVSPETQPLNKITKNDTNGGVKEDAETPSEKQQVCQRKKVLIISAIMAAFLIVLITTVTILMLLLMTAISSETNGVAGSAFPVTNNQVEQASNFNFNPEETVSNVDTDMSAPTKIVNIEYVQTPTSVTVQPGDKEVILGCSFSAPVHCSWKRNAQPVNVADRYSYLHRSLSMKHEDCSIRISSIESYDFAEWSCEYKSTADEVLVLDKPFAKASISQAKKTKLSNRIGSTVELRCLFDEEIDCTWLRNDTEITIGRRYKYTSGNGHRTTDCSIQISKLSAYDVGEWKCTRPADSTQSEAIVKETMTIAIEKK